MPVKVGIIGVGYLGRHHARIFSEMDNARLVAVADTERDRAENIASEYHCIASADFRELLHTTDVLSIVTPTTTHREIALECLRAGKHIFVEKPITSDLEGAEEVISEARKRGLIIQTGHLERFNSGLITLSTLIDNPVFFESERLSPFLGRGTDVDITLDLMIHDIDIILSLAHSEIRSIRAVGADVLTERLDVAKAWIEFENGLSSLITSSRLSKEKRRMLKVFQRESYLLLDFQLQEVTRHYKKGTEIARDVIKPEYREPLKEELKSFINSVIHNKEPLVSGEDGRNALKIALEISHILRNR